MFHSYSPLTVDGHLRRMMPRHRDARNVSHFAGDLIWRKALLRRPHAPFSSAAIASIKKGKSSEAQG
jgi:hypothetical protein